MTKAHSTHDTDFTLSAPMSCLRQRGEAAYLIAWYGDLPIGHALLKWHGSDAEPMVSKLKDCPEIGDLFLIPESRSKGVGSQLLVAAEIMTSKTGYAMVGLAVGMENTRARSLYERRGYRDSGLGEHPISGSFLDIEGIERHWEEVCLYLIKYLRLSKPKGDGAKRHSNV